MTIARFITITFALLFIVSLSHAQILPNPDYSGDINSRSTLTGDWNGQRGEWAKNGYHVELSTVATYQDLFDGGIDEGGNAIGSTDLVFQLDTGKAGYWPGGLLKMRVESRYGESLTGQVGAISPVNLEALFPGNGNDIDNEVLGITEFVVTQFLSETFGVFAGLINTLDGDANALAGNSRSDSHFLNGSFRVSLVESMTAPSVTLGAGMIYLPNERTIASLAIINSEETSLDNPFDNTDGTTLSAELIMAHSVNDLPGSQTFGFLYGFGREYTVIGVDVSAAVRDILTGTPLATEDDSWAFYYNAHQYLKWENDRGWGLFARFGVSDGDVNTVSWNMALGVGGTGFFTSRPYDTYGIGYYHVDTSDSPVLEALNISDEDGFEAWYNFAITPWLGITADIQVIDTAVGLPISGIISVIRPGGPILSRPTLINLPGSNTAWLAGIRARIEF